MIDPTPVSEPTQLEAILEPVFSLGYECSESDYQELKQAIEAHIAQRVREARIVELMTFLKHTVQNAEWQPGSRTSLYEVVENRIAELSQTGEKQ